MLRPGLSIPAVLTLAGLLAAPSRARAAILPIMPGDDFCDAINNQASAGDEVVLAAGEHPGPCAITNGGAEGSPIILRGEDPLDPPHIVYNGNSSNVIDVEADHVTLADLWFGPTNDAIDAIKIKQGSHVTVERCEFDAIGGVSISANSGGTYEDIVIRQNHFHGLQATGIYLGCHSGMASCEALDVVVERNLIDFVDSANVGYGLEIKLDSYGVVRDNVINDTKGPGIEIFGSTDPARKSVVERNLVIGSRNNATLEVGGGPALVRNNVVIGGDYAGLYVYDFGNDVVRDIQVVGNTVVGDAGPAIRISAWAAGDDLELSGNAAWQMAGGGPALPDPIPDIPMLDNVDCVDPDACWSGAVNWNFWPAGGGPLEDAAGAPSVAPPLTDDFCGQERDEPHEVGAFERTQDSGPGALFVDFKDAFGCADLGGGETETGTTGTSETDTSSTGSTTSAGTDSSTSSSSSGDASTGTAGGTQGTSGDPTGASASAGASSSAGSETGSGTDSGDGGDDSGCGCSTAQRGSPLAPLMWSGLALLVLGVRRR